MCVLLGTVHAGDQSSFDSSGLVFAALKELAQDVLPSSSNVVNALLHSIPPPFETLRLRPPSAFLF